MASRGEGERKDLRNALELDGHQVAETQTADQTLRAVCSGQHHALILASRFDRIEPYEFCRSIRMESDLGLIVLAGGETKQCLIDALNAGADDYLTSPVVPRELLARVRAVLRRVVRFDEQGHRIVLHDRVVDLRSHKIDGPGGRVGRLTPKEFLVLQCLAAHANRVCSHQHLARSVWRRDGLGEVEYMRIVIGQLRQKLEPDPCHPRYILTERSIGYRFRIPAAGRNAASGLSSGLSRAG